MPAPEDSVRRSGRVEEVRDPTATLVDDPGRAAVLREDDLDRGGHGVGRAVDVAIAPSRRQARASAGSRPTISARAIVSASATSSASRRAISSLARRRSPACRRSQPVGLGRRRRRGRRPTGLGSAPDRPSLRRHVAVAGRVGASRVARLDPVGQRRLDRSFLASRLDRVPRRPQRRVRPADQREPELVGLGGVDDHPRPRLRLDLEPSVLRLPAAAAESAERVGLARQPLPSAVSSQIVNGPSLTSSTAISSPKRPVATVTPSRAQRLGEPQVEPLGQSRARRRR